MIRKLITAFFALILLIPAVPPVEAATNPDCLIPSTSSSIITCAVKNVATKLPDLIVVAVSYNPNTGNFTAVVKNRGTAATPAGEEVGVGYYVDGIQRSWGTVKVSLAPGEYQFIGTSANGEKAGPYNIPNGEHNIKAVVNDLDRFPEITRVNNYLVNRIVVGGGAQNPPGTTPPPIVPPPGSTPPGVNSNKWHPGIYIKLEDWQLQSNVEMEKIYKEVAETPGIRGIKISALWGRYETRNTPGVSTYNFTQIENILNRLSKMDDKHLIVLIAWRDFTGDADVVNLLPNDMRRGVLWNNVPAWRHIDYDYLWGYKINVSSVGANYAYNMKLWSPVLLARMDSFLKAMAAKIDSHPNFNHITTSESATGDPIIPFGPGESDALQSAGQLAVLTMMQKHFVKSFVVSDFNYSREFVAQAVPILKSRGIGLGSSNSNLKDSLNMTGPNPGVLTYYPKLSGQIVLAPEIQGHDLRSKFGDDKQVDTPPYDYLYKRVRDDLKANYVVIQRNTPYWYGGKVGTKTVPSMLTFLKTYPAIKNDPTGAGGLDSKKPAAF